jgi:amidase
MSTASTASAASPEEIWRWDAAKITETINRGQLSGVEAVRSCLGRIAAVNPRINAVVNVLADEAISAAEARDRAKRDGILLGPLYGVPVHDRWPHQLPHGHYRGTW